MTSPDFALLEATPRSVTDAAIHLNLTDDWPEIRLGAFARPHIVEQRGLHGCQADTAQEVHAYVTGGSASELSLRRNRAALERIAVEQRVDMDVGSIDLSTTFLGMDLPLLSTVCPMGGMPQVWPQGESC